MPEKNGFEKLLEPLGKEAVLADGAMGTLLAQRVDLGGRVPEAINLEAPDAVGAAHLDYIGAGSGVITTNTFGAGPLKLKRAGLAGKSREITAAAVKAALAAREKAGRPVLVAGSLGPSGALPPPLGEVTAEELARNFRVQASVLAESGVDLLLLETMSSVAEARIALEAASDTGKPVVVSFSFTAGRRGPRNLMGESPADVVAAFADADALGANCGEGPGEMAETVSLFRRHSPLPIWVKPNAGRPRLENGQTVFPLGPAEFAAFLGTLLESGARVIGGCCGTGPAHIAALADALAERAGRA